MNPLSIAQCSQVVPALVEGNSIRAIVRMTEFSKDAITRLLVRLGSAAAEYQDRALRNLKCKRIRCDEILAFCYAKDKNVPADKQGKFGYGSVWTWVAMDADSKLIPSFMVGNRDGQTAKVFIDDLKERLAHRVQLTTDGFRPYLRAVEDAFGADVDYAMLVKIFSANEAERERYSPSDIVRVVPEPVSGNPQFQFISTSYVERQNLTIRMQLRRFTRLTNAFSKKLANLKAALSLHFAWYNFCRVHSTLRVTPGMAAGISSGVWELSSPIG